MKAFKDNITIQASVSRAYEQWTQFGNFHHFMEGVKEVKQLDHKLLH